MEDICHAHTLYLLLQEPVHWRCNVCRTYRKRHDLGYRCSQCDFDVDVKCATRRLQKHIIHHPGHKHPLICMTKQILCECDACGKEHKGVFYHCPMCVGPFIHSRCASLPKKLQIQHYTNDFFSHIHLLNLAYTFPIVDQESKFYPLCRVCRQRFSNENLWIYKCEKCRYYTHLDCATSSILTSPGAGKTIKTMKMLNILIFSIYHFLIHLRLRGMGSVPIPWSSGAGWNTMPPPTSPSSPTIYRRWRRSSMVGPFLFVCVFDLYIML
ncbi:hypothetical protein HanRHA438_Chr17g0830661 [Helianthus annuus]|nr:hypothetical protein HanHA89_Chr17g0721151 [Helianthus annuus]KAJ0827856.1 hypothetical protein HanRHA438_Chr17g0830661 [Helianthus annuus]